jgi:hypothetical protein
MQIRRYQKKDSKAVFKLWDSLIGDKWPIDFKFFPLKPPKF